MKRPHSQARSRRARSFAAAAALAAGAWGAWGCAKGEAVPAEALASGEPPSELKLCSAPAPDAGGCRAACGDLQAVDAWPGADAGAAALEVLVELEDEQVLFTSAGVAVFQGGIAVAEVASGARWSGAAALPAADGAGTWAVGIDSDGRLWRATGAGALDAISDRFGLAGDRVLGAAAAGGQSAGFALESGLAVSDGAVLRRYDVHPARLSGGAGALAWVEAGEVRRLEVATGALTRWRLSGAQEAAIAQDGRVAAITAHEIWAGPPGGDLALVYRTPAGLEALTGSGTRFWFLQGGELGTVEGDSVAHTAVPVAGAGAALAPAAGGGVWTLSGGAAQKWTEGAGELAIWQAMVQPVYARVCAACHQAGGGGLPLASLQAWRDNRAAIRARALGDGAGGGRSMPPATSPQPTSDELHQLQCWLDGAP